MSKIIFKAAKYIRLSHADERTKESDSVGNQRKIIDAFLKDHPEIEVVSEYVDDGVSGIIFDRPAFKQMMSDIENKKVNCVIVKDLSRFGREYIETGRYLRRILPGHGVRFIALGDHIDTLTDSSDNLGVSVKTLVNDAYCRDISIKTRTALNIKRDNGDYVGACPIYGYRKAEDNHNQLVIDEYPAAIVRDIFRMKIDGMSALKIAEALNKLGVLCPLEYKKAKGLPYAGGGYADKDGAKWSASTIIRILKDETYTGTLIQGRQGTLNYKVQKSIQKPTHEWKRTESAHEQIIPIHDFDLVQRIMRLDTRTAPGGESVYPLSGLLICGSCGERMTRKAVSSKGRTYLYYFCPTPKRLGCRGAINLRAEKLHDCILESLKAQISNVASIDALLAGSDGQRAAKAIAKQYLAQIVENERQLDTLRKFKSALYENMIGGLITKEEYKKFKADYSADETQLHSVIEMLRQKHEEVLVGKDERLRWMERFKRFDSLAELDRRMVVSLIQSIRVVSKTEIDITFNYQDEYENALMLLREGVA